MQQATRIKRLLLGTLALPVLLSLTMSDPEPDTDWPEYHGDAGRSHFSPLSQITPSNVTHLKVAWTYASGGADTTGNRSQM
jgi:quinoprotein glucose dehydrogenase